LLPRAFAAAGSSVCSQTATRWPALISRLQIILRSLDRHAAHRDVHALMLAALGQDDAERLGGDLGVLEKQLVEIAHPVEQQEPRMAGLDLEVLLHHRRDARVRLRRWRGVS